MRITDLLNSPPVDYRAAIDQLSEAELAELERETAATLQRLAWAAGYIDGRKAEPGHAGHAYAITRANRWLTGLRKMMGFAYPEKSELLV
jgi:transcription initiation factor TFIIIB Brf1 subunit/transcription initiation factor TFIIB